MPLGVLKEDEFLTELEKLNGKVISSAKVIPAKQPGRNGKEETPVAIRKVIAGEPLSAGKELANLFNVSESSVSAYKVGATSTATYNTPEIGLANHARSAREKIALRAGKRLSLALNHITDDKLANAKLSEISGVARDMSTIVKNMEPPAEQQSGNKLNAQFVFFAPRLKSEADYDSVIVSEQ